MNYDRKLTGVVIDPGHGGSDSGAVGNDMLEKDYTLLISKYMYDRFKELGIPVTLTRDSDVSLNPTNRVNKILNAYGNNSDVIVISNHLNAGGGDNPSGKLTFFEKKFNKFSKYDIIFTEKAVFNL